MANEDDFFEFNVVEHGLDAVRVDMMNNQGRPHYSAVGLPEAMVLFVAKYAGRPVSSSVTNGPGGEYRTPAATKVRERLKALGLAKYDASEDRFHHPA